MNWTDLSTGQPTDYTRDVRKAAGYWVQLVRTGQQLKYDPILGPNYMEIRYEDLIVNPEPTLKNLFQFIQEPWDPIVLSYYQFKRDLAGESSAHQVSQPLYKSSMNRWIHDLKSNDKEIVKEVAGNLLIELGYARDFNW
jgi:hypothetical protein